MTAHPSRLSGHSLPREGKTNGGTSSSRYTNGPGTAVCQCGTESPHLPSTQARQHWHRTHKDSIRAAAA